jgi:hypothetical protein|tara:strand:+ start:15 stop:431 length:417 start_codon:yes stop_codon:yes gene_type:complete
MKQPLALFFIGLSIVSAAVADENRAETNYILNCQGCHQSDARGLPGSVPNMKNFVGQFVGVPGGREFLIQVPGSSLSPLSDDALAELLNWILLTKSQKELPADFVLYTGEEVSIVRPKKLPDVAAARKAIVSKFVNQQ